MYDLIYDIAAQREVQERFPAATIKDESDEIHEGRFGVELPDDKKGEYLRWIVTEGWGAVSLGIQLMIYDNDGREKVKGWLAETEMKKSDAGGTK